MRIQIAVFSALAVIAAPAHAQNRPSVFPSVPSVMQYPAVPPPGPPTRPPPSISSVPLINNIPAVTNVPPAPGASGLPAVLSGPPILPPPPVSLADPSRRQPGSAETGLSPDPLRPDGAPENVDETVPPGTPRGPDTGEQPPPGTSPGGTQTASPGTPGQPAAARPPGSAAAPREQRQAAPSDLRTCSSNYDYCLSSLAQRGGTSRQCLVARDNCMRSGEWKTGVAGEKTLTGVFRQ